MSENTWYALKDTSGVNSPSLLVYPERIEENIRAMVAISGSVSNLRPHIKTHKMAEIVQMQQRHGIQKFKCATIAEAELLGQCGAQDILLAMQPVGANISRFFTLMDAFPQSRFSTLVDNETTLSQIVQKASEANRIASLYLDINSGMNRTGCIPDERAVSLYGSMENNPNIAARGFHAYDGHIHISDLHERTEACNIAFQKVLDLKDAIKKEGIIVPDIIAGGSPSFPIHGKRTGVDASPGTTLLWDARYSELFPDMPFLHAAVLFIRIISKPEENIICFDLGHKSVAPEMGFPRVQILGLEDSEQIGQSEEHLVVRTQRADEFEVGDGFYAIPVHICPTVAKYEEVLTISDGAVSGTWKVAARNQKITL
ncbi:D-TA family PLP-dependent enzyme [Maribacter algarum]|uniref:D-TA family PLP-dependent enzyme n=1 Tax=Maribacter algarum (ex Zhang et al. 2020) TaxID=2578118 RepID=A0A5S3PWQ1_9FLAO|nr:D-TA family PLP-dependent enzyme [Maribacter algarum]TMM59403.1 D-TA family PLP-dependent enzyme [Maribacter algarum]